MKKISILGDSISTYQGYTNPAGVFYDLFNATYADMRGVDDTWWMRVIHGLGGTLEVNDSFSSTTVSGSSPLCSCSDERTSALGHPDMILVFMGTNDYGYHIDTLSFERDYRTMLRKLQANYPSAEIWCGTLIWSYCIKEEYNNYYGDLPGGLAALEPYNRIIRAVAKDAGCPVADLAAANVEYAAIDCAHPHADGMKTIAELWLNCLR